MTRRAALFVPLLLLGLVLAGCTDDDGGTSAGGEHPTVGDHWHAAYGVDICGDVLPAFASDNDPVGIHTHADGIIHIHPFSEAAGGSHATLGVFFETMGATLTDDSIDLGEIGTFTEGEDDCDGEAAIVQVARWADADAAADTEPEIITRNVADIAFQNDREAYTIAFLPRGADIPPPSSIPTLDQLTDV